MSDTVEFSSKGLDRVIKALGGPLPSIKVGILGGGVRSPEEEKIQKAGGAFNGASHGKSYYRKILSMRPKGVELTNAEIGAIHEFGGKKTPMRSFLRMPLTENLQAYLDKEGSIDKEAMEQSLREGTLQYLFKRIAATAENVIADAFHTGGFGKWKVSNMKHKKVHQTLVESQQLRNSITSEVS